MNTATAPEYRNMDMLTRPLQHVVSYSDSRSGYCDSACFGAVLRGIYARVKGAEDGPVGQCGGERIEFPSVQYLMEYDFPGR